MRLNIARAAYVILLVASVLLLALGWLAAYASPPLQATLFGLHISLGVIASAAILAGIVLRIVVPPPPYPPHWTRWRRGLAGVSELLLYLSFLAAAVSGASWAAFSGAPLHFFGAPLPVGDLGDPPLAHWLGVSLGSGVAEIKASEAFLAIHRISAGLLAVSIVLNAAVGGPARLETRPPALPVTTPALDVPVSAAQPAAGLAGQMRLLGWTQFWIQLAIALASGVLLQFATAGRAFSPSVSGFGDAIYWSFYGFLLLCAATALAFYYTRAARTVAASADYLDAERMTAFWFISAGVLVGLAGTIISFVGVSLSISLLIAKTVSQPPGIAITDPNRIIRALDVFVLLVNFVLLLAHFIGTGVAAWLAARASQARYRHVTARLPAVPRA
jgi:cytochrome b561